MATILYQTNDASGSCYAYYWEVDAGILGSLRTLGRIFFCGLRQSQKGPRNKY